MSTRTKRAAKPAGKKAEIPAEPTRPKIVRPSGRVPHAVVSSRHEQGMVERAGRGFSIGELAGAGLSPFLARKFGAQTDPNRRSILEANVAALKAWYSPPPKPTVAEGRPKTKAKPPAKKAKKKAEE